MRSTLWLLPFLLLASSLGANDTPRPNGDGDYQLDAAPVEETVWEGKFIPQASVVIGFERGGVLWYEYSDAPKAGRGKGTWKRDGNSIHIEINNYAKFCGTFRGEHIVGEASNVAGEHWKWDVKRNGPIKDRQK